MIHVIRLVSFRSGPGAKPQLLTAIVEQDNNVLFKCGWV